MKTHFRARLTLAAMLAVLAMGVGLSVTQTNAGNNVEPDTDGAPSTPSVAAAFPSVEAHFALRPAAGS